MSAMLLKSKTLSVSINCNPKKVHEFASNPENLPKWAKAFCRSVRKSGNEWIVDSPQGPIKFRFVEKNDLGILDHYVSPSPDMEMFVPMRVISNGFGSEVIFTLFQPVDVPDGEYAVQIGWAEQDLNNLKRVMESK